MGREEAAGILQISITYSSLMGRINTNETTIHKILSITFSILGLNLIPSFALFLG